METRTRDIKSQVSDLAFLEIAETFVTHMDTAAREASEKVGGAHLPDEAWDEYLATVMGMRVCWSGSFRLTDRDPVDSLHITSPGAGIQDFVTIIFQVPHYRSIVQMLTGEETNDDSASHPYVEIVAPDNLGERFEPGQEFEFCGDIARIGTGTSQVDHVTLSNVTFLAE